MSAVRGFIVGTLAVSTMEVLVSSPQVAGRIGSAGNFLADVIGRVVDPDVPAIGAASWQPPAPLSFDQSTPAQPSAPGGSAGAPRSKVLHSTKAKPPRSYAPGVRKLPPSGGT